MIKFSIGEMNGGRVMLYVIPLTMSIILTFAYFIIWHRHFDTSLTLIFACIPVTVLGALLRALASDAGEAIIALKIQYIGGAFLPLLITLSILNLCKIEQTRLLRAVLFLISFSIYCSVLTIGSSNIFYKAFSFEKVDGIGLLADKQYGFMHHVFIASVILYSLIGLIAIIYSYNMKKDVSRKILVLLFLPEFFSVMGFFGQKMSGLNIEFTPFTFVIAQMVYLLIVYRVALYNIDDSLVDTLVETGDTGIISVDLDYHYLGSNETAREIFPHLRNIAIDSDVTDGGALSISLISWIEHFKEDNRNNTFSYESKNHYYRVDVRSLIVGRRKSGYQFFLTDNTPDQEYIKLLDKFNTDLEEEVRRKTDRIVKMHDKLILSMAMMVESRDNSTGGHIMRTSEGVRILINEMIKDDAFQMSDKFCRDIIKAAPMHDLGKVAVDDAVLRKPGKFTPEEFEKMKAHAAEGAKIVHKILEDTDDEEFKTIAENVAHYHHERCDGSGYPNGLTKNEIPLEARIMAIADVYDALVSKRVYKDRMSFEKADEIMMESFGKHFDEDLRKYYIAARPKLEEYYSDKE